MRLSSRAIAICRTKYGKGIFCGFEDVKESVLDDLTLEEAQNDFEELTKNGILDVSEEEVHFNALGHHIFNMMITPEQYIMIDNEAKKLCVRIYVRNTYYLCVLEDKTVKQSDDYNKFTLHLLPTLDLVVSAFVRGLYKKDLENIEDNFISVAAKAWSKDRENISEMVINGCYDQNDICYKKADAQEEKCDVSEFVNSITKWLFEKIAASMESEVQ